jgi:hypothetical protein
MLRKNLAKILVSFLPKYIYKRIGILYGFMKRPSVSYSLYGEDIVISHLFHELGIAKGVYVDIGSFHPKWISNTHLLATSGWTGVAVDIDKFKTDLFTKYRNGCQSITAAVTANDDEKKIKCYCFDRLLSEWDTLSLDEAELRSSTWGVKFEETEIETIGINDVLKATGTNFIDYINIDIEGIDEDLIHAIDFKLYNIKCIQFENNHFFKGKASVQKKLDEVGFNHYATMGGTHTYVNKSLLKISEETKNL